MYAYKWDPETGGYILTTDHLEFSKEPRPVYAKELDILGFDKFCKYEKQSDTPYLWAESNNYIYRGRLIAKIKGGCINQGPKLELIEPLDAEIICLKQVDISGMIEKNRELMEQLSFETKQKIYNTWIEYRDKKKVELFHVSYSGGKDSEVALDLVKSALPANAYVVIFGDTGMEFPDTYTAVEKTKMQCEKEGIQFHIAKSHLSPDESWLIFGPPSSTIRWCCSVHKTVPQLLKLREISQRADFREMAFVGVRGDESARRNGYEYVSKGTKHKGQFSCNPILDWGSAEVYLYLYMNNLQINEAYKKGNNRAGCLVCPMSGDKSDYMRHVNYPEEVERFTNLVRKTSLVEFERPEDVERFFNTGGWKVRKNGRDIFTIPEKYTEKIIDDGTVLTIKSPSQNWMEWCKTAGDLRTISESNNESSFVLKNQSTQIEFTVMNNNNGYQVILNKPSSFPETVLQKMLKQVFRKASYCILCRECEADCFHGYISMKEGHLTIDDKCLKCGNCHKPDLGCLVYQSLIQPKGTGMNTTKSLDCYADHAPKPEWFEYLFDLQERFLEEHTLGTMMISSYKRFLNHAEFYDGKDLTAIARKSFEMGLSNEAMWAIMLVNLCNNSPEMAWYVKNIEAERSYSREMIQTMLADFNCKERAQRSITGAYLRILALPFGKKLGLGETVKEGKSYLYTRNEWQNPNPIVILYSLYKFAEKCGDYYQFTLTRLLDHRVESDGVSPTQIFNLGRETMQPILLGLSSDYPDFIHASFTHDLDNITLRSDKTSMDVLSLL